MDRVTRRLTQIQAVCNFCCSRASMDSTMDKRPTALSLRLYDVLDKVGASESLRRLHRHAAMTHEIMCTLEYDLKSIGTTAYSFGSFCEGTTTRGLQSDVDFLETVDWQPVVEDVSQAPMHGRSHLIVREESTYPGYVKLHTVLHGLPMKAHYGELNFSEFDTNSTGNVYQRHVPYPINEYHERNGPADTYRFESGLSLDRVVAMAGVFIPRFASGFWTRHRPRQWPSRKDLDIMGTLGCFYVGVGHPNSIEYPTEWRVSFSRQERMLMFQLNAVQHRCYVVLKMIKKELIENRLGKSLSSYHCKTCLFHVIENTPAALWTPKHLCDCVILCLTTLYQWMYHTYCPNFFVPEENMFDRKIIRLKRVQLLQILRELVTDHYRFFYKLKTDRVGEFVANVGTNLAPSARLSTSQHGCTLLVRIIEDVLHTDPRKYRVKFFGFMPGDHHPSFIHTKILEWVSSLTRFRGHTEMETRQVISYFIPLLHLNIAQDIISLWFSADSRQTSISLIKAFDYHFQRAFAGYSSVSAQLLFATVLYHIGKYEECKTTLQGIERTFKSYVAPICTCQEKIFKSNVFIWQQLYTNNISVNLFIKHATAPCVQFVPSDIEIVPTALRYEMFRSVGAPERTRRKDADYWYDFAVVDARVYLHFLQYLVFAKLDNGSMKYSALNKLRGTACSQRENLGHRETACNLLGWIYLQEGLVHEALGWFVMSWRLKPFHNAAKWHVRQVMARLLLNVKRHNLYSA